MPGVEVHVEQQCLSNIHHQSAQVSPQKDSQQKKKYFAKRWLLTVLTRLPSKY